MLVDDLGKDKGPLEPNAAFFKSSYDEKVGKLEKGIAQKIVASLKQPNTDSEVLLISEFCWRTGLVVPVQRIKQAIRSLLPEDQWVNFKIIVDGAHFFPDPSGGSGLVHLAEWEAYVLSAHKWLLSPEPCGILISGVRRGGADPFPFDAWHGDVPDSTGSARMLAGVKAGLEAILEFGLGDCQKRIRALRDMFLDRLHPRFQLVSPDHSSSSGSTKHLASFCAIEPGPDFRWKATVANSTNLRRELSNRHLNAKVLDVDAENPWVRASFPFFLDETHILDACRKLSELVK